MMNDAQTISWIFLATALATQTEPSDYSGISSIADGINHAVPNHNELQRSITWLIQKGMVEKRGTKYSLTEKGIEEYTKASATSTKLLEIWKILEKRLIEYT